MREFFIYFFGAGSEVEFSLFTPAHFAPIVVMLAMIWLIYRKRESIRISKHEENLRFFSRFCADYLGYVLLLAAGGRAVVATGSHGKSADRRMYMVCHLLQLYAGGQKAVSV